MVSHYYYHKSRYPDSDLAGLSLAQFVRSEHSIAQNNRQVYCLSGRDPGEQPSAALDEAMDRLRNNVVWFGLTERFNESLLVFKHMLDWPYPPFYVRRKLSKNRPRLEDLPRKTVKLIQQNNELDAKLYDYASSRFDEVLHETVADVNDELVRFRRWNDVVQWLAPPLLCVYRNARRALRRIPGTGR